MQKTFELFGSEFQIDFDAKITFDGCEATGPSYASGGEPACAMEWELDGEITLKKLIWQNERDCKWAIRNGAKPIMAEYVESAALEIPGWLHDEITLFLEADDDGEIARQLEEDAADDGPDPDYEREREYDDANA